MCAGGVRPRAGGPGEPGLIDRAAPDTDRTEGPGTAGYGAPQHRILALDGGGIRGIISVEVLSRIEELLQEGTGRPDLQLCDWFDLIAGTSTGAITAALLATGHTTAEIRSFYETEAVSLFRRAPIWTRLRHRYDGSLLADRLRRTLGPDTTLGCERIRTLLMMVMHNVTTDSPWFLTNHPGAPFNDRALPDCNLNLPLWQLVRASAAAPTYFQPEVVELGKQRFVFSDGVVTGFANPSFKAFLIATAKPYRISWEAGARKLLLVSVGTGKVNLADENLRASQMHLLFHARHVPQAMSYASRDEQDLLCRVFGDCLVGEPLDLEVGDLIGAPAPGGNKLFTYLRYDVPLTREGLDAIGCTSIDPARMVRMDALGGLAELQRVGRSLASERVRQAHFRLFLERKKEDPPRA